MATTKIATLKEDNIDAMAVQRASVLDMLAQIGGKGFKEEDIVFEGEKLILPTVYQNNLGGAIKALERKVQEDEDEASFSKTFNYRPWDGAYCAYQAMKQAFGFVHGRQVQSFFGPIPPEYIQVPISTTETVEVPWGQFDVPYLPGCKIIFAEARDRDLGTVFRMYVQGPRKYKFHAEGLFEVCREYMEKNSIYRGHAIDGEFHFVDLSGIDPKKVVYSAQTEADLETNVWSFMEKHEEYRALGMPSKRSILLYGHYGTGKSLTASLTAIRATAPTTGWTFIMARPGRDDFFEVMKTAKMYQPCVVFMEDAESFASNTAADDDDKLSALLDAFDGLSAKSTKIMVVMTTNHPNRLSEGMRRPGRIDQFIPIENLDSAGVRKLIEIVLGKNMGQDIDWDKVFEANNGYSPAFVKEAADRSLRYAVTRGVKPIKISTDDLVYAAGSMRTQFEWMEKGVDDKQPYTMNDAIGAIVKDAIAELAANSDSAARSVWNQEALAKIQS